MATIAANAAFAWHNRPADYADLINTDFADTFGIRDELDTAAIRLLVRYLINAWAQCQASPLTIALDRLDCDDIVAEAGYTFEYTAFVRVQEDYAY